MTQCCVALEDVSLLRFCDKYGQPIRLIRSEKNKACCHVVGHRTGWREGGGRRSEWRSGGGEKEYGTEAVIVVQRGNIAQMYESVMRGGEQ